MSADDYVSVMVNDDVVLFKKSSIPRLKLTQKVVFDCDGVLVDCRNSYDVTIKDVVNHLFKPISSGSQLIGDTEIEKMRYTGLYNNEWDSCFALVLYVFGQLNMKQCNSVISGLQAKQHMRTSPAIDNVTLLSSFDVFVKGLKSDPIKDAMEYAEKLCMSNGTAMELGLLIKLIGLPNKPMESYLVNLFDSIYYGRELYSKVYGKASILNRERGLIENEKVMIDEKELEAFTGLVKSPFLLLTGRSRIGTEHVLGNLTDYFDVNSSIFIEDILRKDYNGGVKMKKPSATPLLKMADELNTLYVGDSSEDVLMAGIAQQSSPRISFAGVTGLHQDPDSMVQFFMSSRADIIVRTVADLVKTYSLIIEDGMR